MSKHTDEDYLQFDPCEGDMDAEISCRTVAIRKARKEHKCFFGSAPYGDGHTIKPGERYRYEKALVDSDYWGQWACCLGCMDKFLDDETEDETEEENA